MAAVCLYFQIHQPFRLRRYSVFDTGADYFDDLANAAIVRRVAEKCYLPANRLMLELLRRHKGQFRFAVSITGTALESFQKYAPGVLASFRELAETGGVEFLGETYYHSLSVLYSKPEFEDQIILHRQAMQQHLAQTPRIFRNTELIFDNDVAKEAAGLQFAGILTEGWETVLGKKSPGLIYHSAKAPLKILLRNYRLSDDIAFRFGRADWPEWPLTAEKFADRVTQLNDGPLCNLFMDYETIGEHQEEMGGIFAFFKDLPDTLLKAGHTFVTPSELLGATLNAAVDPANEKPSPAKKSKKPVAKKTPASGEKKAVKKSDTSIIDKSLDGGTLDVPRAISWADEARDLSAWLGNAMQTHAIQELYRMEDQIKQREDPDVLATWRKLTTSDHFYYMSTKRSADGQVHSYFNPYESPYDAYINYMNVLDNLRARLRR